VHLQFPAPPRTKLYGGPKAWPLVCPKGTRMPAISSGFEPIPFRPYNAPLPFGPYSLVRELKVNATPRSSRNNRILARQLANPASVCIVTLASAAILPISGNLLNRAQLVIRKHDCINTVSGRIGPANVFRFTTPSRSTGRRSRRPRVFPRPRPGPIRVLFSNRDYDVLAAA